MKKIIDWLKFWIWFFIVLFVWILVTKARLPNSSGLTAQPWDKLTAAKFNALLPAWSVVAFNLASCPTWRIAADGTNLTPDLRGEFIRWVDNGRWIDSGRTLGSWQTPSSLATPIFWGTFGGATTFAWLWLLNSDSYTQQTFAGSAVLTLWAWATYWSLTNVSAWYFTIRPRNVALLYCVKN